MTENTTPTAVTTPEMVHTDAWGHKRLIHPPSVDGTLDEKWVATIKGLSEEDFDGAYQATADELDKIRNNMGRHYWNLHKATAQGNPESAEEAQYHLQLLTRGYQALMQFMANLRYARTGYDSEMIGWATQPRSTATKPSKAKAK